MEATATTHKIIAAPWQLQAAQHGRLGAVIVPLVPEPRKWENTWNWHTSPIDLFWFENESVGERLIKKLPYQTGDRLYLAEQWCKAPWGNDEGKITSEIYFTESTVPEAEHIGWQPAATMPPEAAQWWFDVTGVNVMRLANVPVHSFIGAGLSIKDEWEFKGDWNTAHPDHTWADDRWVVVMEVKSVSNPA
jgi:hypothetical protein